jgi:hypothetical protein
MKREYKAISISLLIIGIALISIQPYFTGAIVGKSTISSLGSILGILLVIVSLLLNIEGESLEERLKVKRTKVQKRGNQLYLVNTSNSDSYSLKEVKELSKDYELKKSLRSEYFSDLLKSYASSPESDKWGYKAFIQALSPNANEKTLDRRLEQFQDKYNKLRDKLHYSDPGRIKKAEDSDFGDSVYVRFEDESETQWPRENSIGLLPFNELKENKSRGPALSVVPVDRLVHDKYLLEDGKTLNPSWSQQKRQDYLRDTHGIDKNPRKRKMIFFKLERDAKLQESGNYENIIVKDKVPLVKIIYKK